MDSGFSKAIIGMGLVTTGLTTHLIGVPFVQANLVALLILTVITLIQVVGGLISLGLGLQQIYDSLRQWPQQLMTQLSGAIKMAKESAEETAGTSAAKAETKN